MITPAIIWYLRLTRLLKEIMDGSRILIYVETKKGRDQVTRKHRMHDRPINSLMGDQLMKGISATSKFNLRLC